MAERSKAAVLKTADPRGSVGSNPTSSAIKIILPQILQMRSRHRERKEDSILYFFPLRPLRLCGKIKERGEMAELAEGARLLIVCALMRRTEGSNPSLSANENFRGQE